MHTHARIALLGITSIEAKLISYWLRYKTSCLLAIKGTTKKWFGLYLNCNFCSYKLIPDMKILELHVYDIPFSKFSSISQSCNLKDIWIFKALMFPLWSLFMNIGASFSIFMWKGHLTQDFNKSGKKYQMREIRIFSLLVHKNLIQY